MVFTLATSRLPNGRNVAGQEPLPVLRNGRAIWAQPVAVASGPAQAELRVVDLATRRSRALLTGRVSSPVFAGPYLIWATINGANQYGFEAADGDTLTPVRLPPTLRRPQSLRFIGANADYFAWGSLDSTHLTVWRIGTDHYREFVASDGRHMFQFLRLSGHFLVWFAATTSSVLDLDTGAGFDVPEGGVAGSAEWIVKQEPVTHAGKGAPPAASRVSRIATTEAPSIAHC